MKPRLLFVVGPTASGKSDAAVEISERFKAGEDQPEIINSDSVQFFSGVNIGAAKPGPELLSRVRHHLLGHMTVGSTYTAAQFRDDALKLIVTGESARWLVVGG